MKITEAEMIAELDKAKKVLLIEPLYKRKYIPLGLAKISSYLKARNATVDYSRKVVMGDFYDPYDLICITSLFTFDSAIVDTSLKEIQEANPNAKILIGGVYASLMPNRIPENVMVYVGNSETLDRYVPDYTLDYKIEEPWDTFSFLFSTRGCPNRCPYCSVWKLEPNQWTCPNWRDHILDSKPNVMISDNNLSSFPLEHLKELSEYLILKKKRVTFDNGFDCKHITKEFAEIVSKLKYGRRGFRLAFDRIEEDGIFQRAVELLKTTGVAKSNIMAYTLFNFTDTPQEANYRMSQCVKLGIRPYPQQYEPLNEINRDKRFVGKHWTIGLLKPYRYFWLMAGFFTKMTFEEFINSDKCKWKLSQEDLDAFYKGKT